MVVLTLVGAIPKDTPSFQEYAFHAMFTNAQAAAAKWNLDQSLIATNRVTRWTAAAYRSGVNGVIIFGGRYAFLYQGGGLTSFSDRLYTPSFLMPGDKAYKSKMKLWLAATNLLSLEQARTIADSALKTVGLEPARTGARPQALGGQATTPWKDVSEALPYYYFDWRTNRFTRRARRGVRNDRTDCTLAKQHPDSRTDQASKLSRIARLAAQHGIRQA